MKKYKSLFEYDPKMMRALYRGGKKGPRAPLPDYLTVDKWILKICSTLKVKQDDLNLLNNPDWSRIVCYGS